MSRIHIREPLARSLSLFQLQPLAGLGEGLELDSSRAEETDPGPGRRLSDPEEHG